MKTYIIAISLATIALVQLGDLIITHVQAHSFLSEANEFKREIINYYASNAEMIQSIIDDGDEDLSSKLQSALEEHGYFDNTAKIDSLFSECL